MWKFGEGTDLPLENFIQNRAKISGLFHLARPKNGWLAIAGNAGSRRWFGIGRWKEGAPGTSQNVGSTSPGIETDGRSSNHVGPHIARSLPTAEPPPWTRSFPAPYTLHITPPFERRTRGQAHTPGPRRGPQSSLPAGAVCGNFFNYFCCKK
jgi:hypothetical protein